MRRSFINLVAALFAASFVCVDGASFFGTSAQFGGPTGFLDDDKWTAPPIRDVLGVLLAQPFGGIASPLGAPPLPHHHHDESALRVEDEEKLLLSDGVRSVGANDGRVQIDFLLDSNYQNEKAMIALKDSLEYLLASLDNAFGLVSVSGLYNGPYIPPYNTEDVHERKGDVHSVQGNAHSDARAPQLPVPTQVPTQSRLAENEWFTGQSPRVVVSSCFGQVGGRGGYLPVKSFSALVPGMLSVNAAGDLPTNSHLLLLGALLENYSAKHTAVSAGDSLNKHIIVLFSGSTHPMRNGTDVGADDTGAGADGSLAGAPGAPKQVPTWKQGEIDCSDAIPSVRDLRTALLQTPQTRIISFSKAPLVWQGILREVTGDASNAYDLGLLDEENPQNFARSIFAAVAQTLPSKKLPANRPLKSYLQANSVSTVCFIRTTTPSPPLTGKQKTGVIVGVAVLGVVLIGVIAAVLMVDKTKIISPRSKV